MTDLAELAYTTWVENRPLEPDEDVIPWEELDSEETVPWVAVEQVFTKLRDGDLDEGPDTLRYELAHSLPDRSVGKQRRKLTGTKHRKRARAFEVRRPRAEDCVNIQEHSLAEQDLRLTAGCMSPVPRRDLFRYSDFLELDAYDLGELKSLVLDGWRSLEGHLYEAWVEAQCDLVDLETARNLHPDDVADFLELERGAESPRPEIVEVLERRLAEGEGGRDESTNIEDGDDAGPVRWPDDEPKAWARETIAPCSWRELVRMDRFAGAERHVWWRVALALAQAGEGEQLSLFTPGCPRQLTPKIARMRTKDVVAVRKGRNDEDAMLRLAASLCDVEYEKLLRLSVDDFERLVFVAQREWLGNREREMGSASGSPGGRSTSRSSPTPSVASSPSP